MKATKKQITIDFFTFDEIVEIGKKTNPDSINNGMPWSFEFEGVQLTHENDECYIVPTLEGNHFFTPNDVLIKGVKGELYPCKKDIFIMTYDTEVETSFIDRLLIENNELTEKAEKLYDVIFTHNDKGEVVHNIEFKNKVGHEQYRLLCAQYYAMASYAEILNFRIELLNQ